MSIKMVVGGAQGRVGQNILALAKEDPEFQVVAEVTRSNPLEEVNQPFDVFIDFTSAQALENHLKYCLKNKVRMIVGVTGLSDHLKQALEQASKTIPVVYSPNMSLGINLSFKVLELIAKTLQDYPLEVAIQETHRKHKKDAPSGTALKMGEILAKARGKTLDQSDISFASTRLGENLGEHTVLFDLGGEQLEIKHKTESRIIYARGALKAAKWLFKQSPGLYDMQDIVFRK